jgi:hypothetical protein
MKSDGLEALEALAVDINAPTRMPIIWPGEIDPITDDTGGVDEVTGKLLPGKEAYLEFLPYDCDENRALDRKNHVDGVRKGFRQRSLADLRKEAESEDPVEDQVDRLVALIVGWYLVGPDRKAIDFPFSKENARKLFSNPRFSWMRRRGFTYVVNEKNFMKSSPKNS